MLFLIWNNLKNKKFESIVKKIVFPESLVNKLRTGCSVNLECFNIISKTQGYSTTQYQYQERDQEINISTASVIFKKIKLVITLLKIMRINA